MIRLTTLITVSVCIASCTSALEQRVSELDANLRALSQKHQQLQQSYDSTHAALSSHVARLDEQLQSLGRGNASMREEIAIHSKAWENFTAQYSPQTRAQLEVNLERVQAIFKKLEGLEKASSEHAASIEKSRATADNLVTIITAHEREARLHNVVEQARLEMRQLQVLASNLRTDAAISQANGEFAKDKAAEAASGARNAAMFSQQYGERISKVEGMLDSHVAQLGRRLRDIETRIDAVTRGGISVDTVRIMEQTVREVRQDLDDLRRRIVQHCNHTHNS